LSQIEKTRLVKLKHPQCVVNGTESYREAIVSGDVVDVDGVEVEALCSPSNFLGGFYLLVKDCTGGENEKKS
jgi:predicted flavoprotein YhiN